jgi:hypothetical protein
MIINHFITNKIKPLNDINEFNREQNVKSEKHRTEQLMKQKEDRLKGIYNNGIHTQYVPEKFIPLFC